MRSLLSTCALRSFARRRLLLAMHTVRLINIADLAAFEAWTGYVPHGASKAGVVHITRALAKVLAPRLRVNAIAPGAVLLPDNWSSAEAERLVRTTPLERLGAPEDVTQALLYLIDAKYVHRRNDHVDVGVCPLTDAARLPQRRHRRRRVLRLVLRPPAVARAERRRDLLSAAHRCRPQP